MSSSKLVFIAFLIIFTLVSVSYTISPTKADVDFSYFDENLFLIKKFNDVEKKNIKTFIVTVTGYSSTYEETDDTPFITASGDFVSDGVVAANFLPLGTKIRIPSLFGDKVFEVKDRMNERYFYRIDVWFPDKESALRFGIHYNVKIEVLD